MFTLHNGDCLQVLPSIPSGSIDAIITDIPYGTTACAWDEVIPLAEMWREVKRVLKPSGAFITTSSQPFTSVLINSNLAWFKHEWIWDKVNHSNFMTVKFEPLKTHESILVFCQASPTYNPQLVPEKTGKLFGNWTTSKSDHHQTMKHTGRGGVGYPKSIIRELRPNNLTGGGLHPTQKPVKLYRYLVRTYTNEGETVLDFTMGSGTTGVACVQEGREFIGIEKELSYFSIAESRLKEAVLQPSLFTPSNNRLHLDVGDSPAQQALFTPEADSAEGKLSAPAPRR
jgi:site-specific DNA-methyltransferase (adenine-specific)